MSMLGGLFGGRRAEAPAVSLIRRDAITSLLVGAVDGAVDGDRVVADELMVLYVALDDTDARSGERLLHQLCADFPSADVVDFLRAAGYGEPLIQGLRQLRVQVHAIPRDDFEDDAERLYLRCVSGPRPAHDYELWVEQALERRLMAFGITGARARVSLVWHGDAPGAVPAVEIDGVPCGNEVTIPTAKPFELAPGTHRIAVHASGEFETWSADVLVHGDESAAFAPDPPKGTIALSPGEEITIPVVLAKRPPRVKIDLVLLPSVAVVRARVDGQAWQQLPIAREVPLSTGEHTLEAEARGYPLTTWQFTVPEGRIDTPAFFFRLPYGKSTEEDVAGYLHRIHPADDEYDRISLRFGSNLIGRRSAQWSGEYDVPLLSRFASRWHAEIVVQEQDSTPDPDELDRLEFVLRDEEAAPRYSPYDVLLRVFGKNGLMAAGVHRPGLYGAGIGGSRVLLQPGEEIGFPGSLTDMYWFEPIGPVLGHGPRITGPTRANVKDGWELAWQVGDGPQVAKQISEMLRRWGKVSIGSGICNPARINHAAVREVHLILEVPGGEERGWLAVAPPRDEGHLPSDQIPDAVGPNDTFTIGPVEFTLIGPEQ
jgi:hypothetical protein